MEKWSEAQSAIRRLREACEGRAIRLSITAKEREEHWQSSHLTAKGVGRTEHLEHLDPKKRLQGAFAAVLAMPLLFLAFKALGR